jgi:hypothetical protein
MLLTQCIIYFVCYRMCCSLERLSVSYQSSATELDLQGNVGCIQIDNHMPRAPFPVMLQVQSYNTYI